MRRFTLPALLAASVLLGAASPAPLLSYRAQYEVALAPGATARDIVGLRGWLVTEFRESCGGYSEAQRFIADMTDADENTLRTDFSATTWESADGDKFDFTVADQVVGKSSQRYEGHAETTRAGGGKATFSVPQGGALELPKGTLFPTEFSERLIASARGGESSFSATVFQGDDLKQLYVASAFIGREVTSADEEIAGAPAMRGVRSWPMIISYHLQGSEDAAPAYEMTFRGYENGVTTGVRMRYPHFSLHSRLVKFEVLPAACDRAAAPVGENK